MSKYTEVKTLLKGDEVVRHYLGEPDKITYKGIWYKSPFRKEKTASFYVSDKGIHDFGDSEHYDIISFVAKYFNTDNYNALKILCNDFGLNLLDKKESKETIKKLKVKREQERRKKEQIEKWFNLKMQKLSDELIINTKLLKIFEKYSWFRVLENLYDEQAKLEIEFETMLNAKNKTLLYEEETTWQNKKNYFTG